MALFDDLIHIGVEELVHEVIDQEDVGFAGELSVVAEILGRDLDLRILDGRAMSVDGILAAGLLKVEHAAIGQEGFDHLAGDTRIAHELEDLKSALVVELAGVAAVLARRRLGGEADHQGQREENAPQAHRYDRHDRTSPKEHA